MDSSAVGDITTSFPESQLSGWSPSSASQPAPSMGAPEDLKLSSGDSPPRRREKQQGPPRVIPPKKKLTKKERRELQERQRAAKEAAKMAGSAEGVAVAAAAASAAAAAAAAAAAGEGETSSRRPAKGHQGGGKKTKANERKDGADNDPNRTRTPQVQLFSHLPQHQRQTALSREVGFSQKEKVHPAIVALGLQYAEGTIRGANARCIALLTALKQVVRDYVTPRDKELRYELCSTKHLSPLINFLSDCRPHSVSMGNAIKWFKYIVGNMGPEFSDDARAKEYIYQRIDIFIQERITYAGRLIVDYAISKIVDGDVILTYARSHVVEMMLLRAKAQNKQFRVVVVDSRPLMEGRQLLHRLSAAGIKCTYILLNAVSYVMREVTKVFMGAAALMANGAVLSRVGTSVVAMMAQAYNVPVIFCCETYKFCDRVQLDSIVSNELGNPDDLVSVDRCQGNILDEQNRPAALKILNLVYDLTPVRYVALVISEVGMTPPTSVPVLLREMKLDEPRRK